MLIFVTVHFVAQIFIVSIKKEKLGHFYTSGQTIYFIISYLVYK